MATVSYISATSTAPRPSPPSQQDTSSSPSTPPTRPPTKLILPKKKPMKWSTGVAPGEYGGPPTTTKLRKYWGGDGDDPLTSDDFIWNKDFMPRMKKLVRDSDVDDESPATSTPVKDDSSGFLSLTRAMSLDSMEVDLSKQLTEPSKAVLEPSIKDITKESSRVSPKWKLVPTRREQEKWDRATKAATGGSDVMLREVSKPRGDPEVLAAQSRAQYFKLKRKLQLLTAGIGAVGFVSAYVSYSPEIAASFGAGLIGSFVYIRMLGSGVDSMADGAKGLIKGAIAQPRLLVPVVLVMVYNRWNQILVPDYGFMHLELIPMLVGFFTYKIATFVQAIEDALTVGYEKTQV